MDTDYTNQSLVSSYIFDIANLCILYLFIFLIYKIKKFDNRLLFLLIISSLTPFLFNTSIISPTNFPDQGSYVSSSMNFRRSFFDPSYWYLKLESFTEDGLYENGKFNFRVFWANIRISSNAFLYSVMPFNIQTIKSIAFINKFLFYLTIFFLLKKKAINNLIAIFLIISPTIIIHTSTSLRDIIVLLILILGSFYTFKEKSFRMQILVCVLLALFRGQYLIVFLIFMFFEYFFYDYSNKKKLGFGIFILSSVFLLLLFFIEPVLEQINFLRAGFFAEENTYGNLAWQDAYQDIDLSVETLKTILIQNIRYVFTPLSISNIFLMILTIENFIILFVLGYFLYELQIKRKRIFDILILYFISSNFFSILVFNIGSLYRYRFPLMFFYILTSYWMIKNKQITPKVLK